MKQMLVQGFTYAQIAKNAHVSPKIISKVAAKYRLTNTVKIKSKRTRALEMYNEGHSAYEVVIRLEISNYMAEKWQFAYWKLRDLETLELLFKELKGNVRPLITLHNELVARDLRVVDVMGITKKFSSREKLDEEIKARHEYIQIQKDERDKIIAQIQAEEKALTSLQNAAEQERLAYYNTSMNKILNGEL